MIIVYHLQIYTLMVQTKHLLFNVSPRSNSMDLIDQKGSLMCPTGPSEAGRLGRSSVTLYNLLKFVDCVSERGCESQGHGNEDLNSYIFEEATRIYPKWNIFYVIQLENLEIFREKTPISRDPLLLQWQIFRTLGNFKNGTFSNDLKSVIRVSL